MKTIHLGKSDLQASNVALGCMRIAELREEALEELLFTALELGVDFFDHADIYGQGSCEEKFGAVLAKHYDLRSKIKLQTKCGIRKGFFDFSREHILKSVDQSLLKLQTDYLDVLLLHRPDTLMEPEEVADAFSILHSSGKVRYFGMSNQNAMQLQLLQKFLPFKIIVNQLQFGPAHTLMIDTGLNVNIRSTAGTMYTDGVLEYCRMNDITIQTWSPFLYGFFEGNFLTDAKYTVLRDTLRAIGARHGLDVSGAAVAWIARHPAEIQTIVGTTNPEHLRAACAGSDIRLSREEWYEIYRSAGNRLP